MAEELTRQQKQAVENRGGKLLVSAAAGSGKTKVLVDRVLGFLTDPIRPANLDDFLIITYTKAAASELRGKIAKRLTEAVAQAPQNRHLQKQLQRLYLTKISTVHAFCADILREYAYCLDISADFRVADENECFELMNRVMQQVLDAAYENAEADVDFRALVDTQGFGRDDRQIPEIIMKVYNSAKCHLNPEQWLGWCVSLCDDESIQDASETLWGQYLIDDLHRYLDLQIATLQRAIICLNEIPNSQKVSDVLGKTIDQLSILCSCQTWDSIYKNREIDYGRLTFPNKFQDPELKEQIKAVRDNCKAGLGQKLRRFCTDSTQLLLDIQKTRGATRGLISLVDRFGEAYAVAKANRRVLDFSDLEHKMLDLLIGKNRNTITRVALEIGARFREIMVDEYQDTNAVQDAIFNALTSQQPNCFMVGDVKQSIYQFRLADPGIFLNKYDTFRSVEEAGDGEGRKILLSHNFRSASNVIQAVNDVFTTCMTKQVGGLVYGAEEQLNEGIPHTEIDEREISLYAIEGYDDVYGSEAAFVADKVAELIDGSHMIRSRDGLRPIQAEDIVILLRSPGSVGAVYQFALEQNGIRCVSGGSADMLQTEEIEVLRSLLQIIHNPLQDIPLLSVLTSRIIGFTADEIAAIRSACKYKSVFEALRKSQTEKAVTFIELLNTLRKAAQMDNLANLLMQIFSVTHIDSIYGALPDGVARVENLQNFCRLAAGYEKTVGGGLSRFLEHLSIMEKRGLEVTIEQDTCGAVQIMSIHKSKGLEFPVVFLCGLSRQFNMESARAQVLCDKSLGLGMSSVDTHNAVRYPSLAKQAIAQKIMSDSISEEMRVLYVAMTRAQDRLIMTYTQKNVQEKLAKKQYAMALSEPALLTEDVDCAGDWILQTAMTKCNEFWHIFPGFVEGNKAVLSERQENTGIPTEMLSKIQNSLNFVYPFVPATQTPSKLTATQVKGRDKDAEILQQAENQEEFQPVLRSPSFSTGEISGTVYGNTIHRVMQFIRFKQCTDVASIKQELERLVTENAITSQEADMVEVQQIADFFHSDVGQLLISHPNVVREFKFSILDDASKYCDGVENEKVLLQGVVDCALIFDESILILDFKTDRVTEESLQAVSGKYYNQIITYAEALSKIFGKPVSSAQLYFFKIGKFVNVI